MGPLRALVALASPLGAVLAVMFSFVVRVNLCEGCQPKPAILTVQVVLAIAGLVPVAVLIGAEIRDKPKLFAAALGVGLATYAAWAVLVSVATDRY